MRCERVRNDCVEERKTERERRSRKMQRQEEAEKEKIRWSQKREDKRAMIKRKK